jgi:phage shock protein A
VKDAFIKNARDVPPEISMLLSQGRDFGPALKKFDGASNYEARMKALPDVLRAKTDYEDEIGAALKKTESKIGKKAQEMLLKQIDGIWKEVEVLAQPPRPSGQMVSSYTLRSFNLAAGVKTKCLKVNPIPITVEIEVDKVFKELIDSGAAGLRADELGEVALKELEKVSDAFRDTIMTVDAGIEKDISTLEAKTKEANEVLAHYGRIVEDRVNVAVQTAWKSYLQRKKDLTSFQIKSATKIVLGTIGVAVAVASVVASFGTAWMNIIAACKGIAEVGKAIKTAAEGIDTVYAKLIDDMEHVDKLNQQREAAKKKGDGQKASKAKQVGKELVAAVLPVTKDMLKATSAIEARCVQFNGLISKLEASVDELSGKIEKITKNLTGLPDRMLGTEQINLNRRMNKTVKSLFDDIAEMHKNTKKCTRFSDAAMKAVKKLKAEDSWIGTTETGGSVGSKGVAIYALANFCLACADNGKQLLSLLPV